MFTRENLEKLEVFFQQIEELGKEIDSMYSEYAGTAKERKYKVNRQGKDVEVTEDILWYEAKNLGYDSEAVQILSEVHPYFFEQSRKREQIITEMEKFVSAEFSINPLRMSIVDVMKISIGITEMLLKEKGEN